VVTLKHASHLTIGLAAKLAGYALLVFVIFASMFAGFQNLNLVRALNSGSDWAAQTGGVVGTYVALLLGIWLALRGRR
jgi:hypothetical protein